MSNITIEQVKVTPEQAQEYLQNNLTTNRKLRNIYVNKYVTDMQSGNWRLGDPLKFDKNGVLIDGQHRLSAVVKFGKPVDFLVVNNYDTETASVLDIGVRRSITDIARVQGEEVSKIKVATIRAMLNFYPGLNHTQTLMSKVTEQEIIDWYIYYADYVDYACDLNAKKGINKALFTGVLARAAIHYDVIQNPNSEDAQRLAELKEYMVYGFTNEKKNPLIPYRDMLFTAKSKHASDRLHCLLLGDYAITLYMNHETRKVLRLPSDYKYRLTVPLLDELFDKNK